MKSVIVIFFILFISAAAGAFAQTQDANPAWREKIIKRLDHILEEKYYSHRRGGEQILQRSAQTQSQIGAEVLVSGMSKKESEIHAAINPADTTNIVIAPIQSVVEGGSFGGGQLALPLYVTKDFGRTWQKSSFSPGGSGGGDPVLAFDAAGKLYFSWLELNFSGMNLSITIQYAYSTDGGTTWTTGGVIDSGSMSFTGAGRMVDKQWMDVDLSTSSRRNTLYTTYVVMEMQGATQQFGIALKKKLPASAQFDAQPVILTDASFSEVQFPSVNVDADGNVHVFWWGVRNGQNGLWHRMSSDGTTFGDIHKAADVRFPAQSQNQTVPAHLPQRLGVMPQFEVDWNSEEQNRNALYAVWNANAPGTTAGSFNEPFYVYFSCSYDLGATWTAPRRMAEVEDLTASQFHPSISVNPQGDVIVTWYDARDNTQNTSVHYYAAVSKDGGRTWNPNIRVSGAASNVNKSIQGDFGIGDYDRAISTNHYAIPVWCDGRTNDGNLNIYAAFVPLDGMIPVELASFTAHVDGKLVTLRWDTESETNNAGFEVQPSADGTQFETRAFVPGQGTSFLPHSYMFEDFIDRVTWYRLKQIDYDGSHAYSPTVRAVPLLPSGMTLDQNYPNPVHGSTSIGIGMDDATVATLCVYDALGRVVREIVSGKLERGAHTFTWDAKDASGNRVPAGTYMYTLAAGETRLSKLMTVK